MPRARGWRDRPHQRERHDLFREPALGPAIASARTGGHGPASFCRAPHKEVIPGFGVSFRRRALRLPTKGRGGSSEQEFRLGRERPASSTPCGPQGQAADASRDRVQVEEFVTCSNAREAGFIARTKGSEQQVEIMALRTWRCGAQHSVQHSSPLDSSNLKCGKPREGRREASTENTLPCHEGHHGGVCRRARRG